jgi:basic membrane lipoprotein Med (substrate-binding protein (PBP1-ABC) superfamily)
MMRAAPAIPATILIIVGFALGIVFTVAATPSLLSTVRASTPEQQILGRWAAREETAKRITIEFFDNGSTRIFHEAGPHPGGTRAASQADDVPCVR